MSFLGLTNTQTARTFIGHNPAAFDRVAEIIHAIIPFLEANIFLFVVNDIILANLV